MSKQQFLDLLKSMNDTNFFVIIIRELFKLIPNAVSWKLSQQLYMEYYYEGTTYKVENLISHEITIFPTIADVVSYLRKLGYKATASTVKDAFVSRAADLYNHRFYNDAADEVDFYIE